MTRSASPAVGQPAPELDLASTSGAMLMLRDELARTAVLLYFFTAPADERAHTDLGELARAHERLGRRGIRVLAVAPAPLAGLARLRATLDLPFPLLADDRRLHRLYGVPAPQEGAAGERALVLVDRRQRISRSWPSVPAVSPLLPEIEAALAGSAEPRAAGALTAYPGAVINRWVEWWLR